MGGVLTSERRSASLLGAAGLVALGLLASGCPFSTFSVGDELRPSGGQGGARGGSPPTVSGGSPTGGSGAKGGVAPPHLQSDRYFMVQDQVLHVGAEKGVLANDSPPELSVFDSAELPSTRPSPYDATWTIDARGMLDFTPARGFVGVYELSYRARNSEGAAASATVAIHVLPWSFALEALEDGIGGVVLEGNRGDQLGAAVIPAGDVNGDGLDDLLIGAPGDGGGDGAAYLVFGSTDFRALSLSPSAAGESQPAFLAFIGGPGDAVGSSLAALRAETGKTLELVIGAPGGFGRAEFVPVADLPASGQVVLDPDQRFSLLGDEREAGVGAMLAPALDVDGDLRPDLLVASQRNGVGVLHLVYGNEIEGESRLLADEVGQVLHGSAPDDGFPLSIAGIGDTDHDGNSEVLMATPTNLLLLAGGTDYPPSEVEVSIDGSAYGWRALRVAPGTPASVASIGDLDADGAPDFAYCEGAIAPGTDQPGERTCRVVTSPPSTLANGFRVTGFGADTTRVTVAPAGDFDGDAVPDLVFSEDSVVHVVYGRRALNRDVSVASLSEAGFRLTLPRGGRVGVVTDAGDLNGDGASELAISEPGSASRPGRVYVLFGMAAR
jgi:hypothetical protein